jgi:hypothetical protein
VLATRTQHLNQIDAIDTAAGALGHVALVAEHHTRAVVLARHPAMSIFTPLPLTV